MTSNMERRSHTIRGRTKQMPGSAFRHTLRFHLQSDHANLETQNIQFIAKLFLVTFNHIELMNPKEDHHNNGISYTNVFLH